MNRRTFAGLSLAALGGIFAPKFGPWYRRGSGVLVAQARDLIVLPEPRALYGFMVSSEPDGRIRGLTRELGGVAREFAPGDFVPGLGRFQAQRLGYMSHIQFVGAEETINYSVAHHGLLVVDFPLGHERSTAPLAG